MDDLIARLEMATGPSVELDLAIGRWLWDLGNTQAWQCFDYDSRNAEGNKPFTASIDAALTLVPAGWRWRVGDYNINPMPPHAELAEIGQIIDYGIGIKCRVQAKGAAPALALCIAAIKARQIVDQEK